MFRLDRAQSGGDGEFDRAAPAERGRRFFTGAPVESYLSVVGGIVCAGTFGLSLLALDALTGEMPWRFHVDGLLRSPDETVYVGANDSHPYAAATATLACTTASYTAFDHP